MIPKELRKITAVSVAISVLVFAWILTAGRFDVFAWQFRAADFYDAQAHSWLRGSWAIEPGVLGIEAFEVNGAEYTYFGVFPVLMRLPVAFFTNRLDGRLTQISMLTAYIIILVTLAQASWLIRCSLQPRTVPERAKRLNSRYLEESISSRDRIIAFLVPLVGGLSSTLLYLSSRAWVYHEAILWGVALALISLVALFHYLGNSRSSWLVLAGVAAIGSLHSRPSVGLGPLVALALLGGLSLWQITATKTNRKWWLISIPAPRRTAGITAATGVAALISYAFVNVMRFGELFRLPLELQTYALQSSERQAVLAANGGSFFGLQFLPTTLFAYLRPDGLSLSRVFPFIGFAPDIRVFGQVSFDTLDPVASLSAAMPLLLVGAAAGTFWVLQAFWKRQELGRFTIPLLGAAAGAGTTLVFGYIAARYQGDTMPFLLLASLVAVHQFSQVTDTITSVGLQRTILSVAAMLALWGVATNAALAIGYQQQVAPDVRPELRGRLLASQLNVARWLPGARKPHVERGETLPAQPSSSPTVFVLGQCQAVYFGPDANGRWSGVERTRSAGFYQLEVVWNDIAPGVIQPILANHQSDTGLNALVVRDETNGQVRVGYLWSDETGTHHEDWGKPFSLNRHQTIDMKLVFDPNNVEISVEIDGRLRFEGFRFYPTPGEEIGISFAGGQIAPEFLGSITLQAQPELKLCPRL